MWAQVNHLFMRLKWIEMSFSCSPYCCIKKVLQKIPLLYWLEPSVFTKCFTHIPYFFGKYWKNADDPFRFTKYFYFLINTSLMVCKCATWYGAFKQNSKSRACWYPFSCCNLCIMWKLQDCQTSINIKVYLKLQQKIAPKNIFCMGKCKNDNRTDKNIFYHNKIKILVPCTYYKCICLPKL